MGMAEFVLGWFLRSLRPPLLDGNLDRLENSVKPIGYEPSLPQFDADVREAVVQRIISAIAPEKIVLFGSRARGTHRPNSDIDLLVVTPSSTSPFLLCNFLDLSPLESR